jgi:molybdopterin synthase sulfur carrier subunit
MAQISFTANLRRHVPCPPATIPAGSLREALDIVFDANPRLRGYVLDEQGRLRRHVNIFIGERAIADRVALSDRLGPDDEVFVMQALSGG